MAPKIESASSDSYYVNSLDRYTFEKTQEKSHGSHLTKVASSRGARQNRAPDHGHDANVPADRYPLQEVIVGKLVRQEPKIKYRTEQTVLIALELEILFKTKQSSVIDCRLVEEL